MLIALNFHFAFLNHSLRAKSFAFLIYWEIFMIDANLSSIPQSPVSKRSGKNGTHKFAPF